MITEAKSSKRTSHGIIAVAALLLIAGAVWWGSHQPVEINQASIMAEAVPTVAAVSQPTPSVIGADASPAPKNPLTPEEVNRLVSWYKERGGTDDGRMLADGSVVGGDAFSSYRTASDADLAIFAKNDPYAAEILGTRLAERYRETHQNDDLKEAKHLLLEATTCGFTTSLEKLLDLQVDVVESRGVEVPKGVSRTNKQALLEAYQYLYLLERRGSPGIDAHKVTVKAADQNLYLFEHRGEPGLNIVKVMAQDLRSFTADEDALARQRADELYQAMAEQRQQLGLPPFDDGVPADIQDIFDRAMAYTVASGK